MVGEPPAQTLIDAYEDSGGNLVAGHRGPARRNRRYGVLDVVADRDHGARQGRRRKARSGGRAVDG